MPEILCLRNSPNKVDNAFPILSHQNSSDDEEGGIVLSVGRHSPIASPGGGGGASAQHVSVLSGEYPICSLNTNMLFIFGEFMSCPFLSIYL